MLWKIFNYIKNVSTI